jgi:hypothetical protein
MVLQKNPMSVRQPLEYVPIAQLPEGQKGMVFFVSWAVESKPVGGPEAGGGYIEGCWQFYRTANETFPGLGTISCSTKYALAHTAFFLVCVLLQWSGLALKVCLFHIF